MGNLNVFLLFLIFIAVNLPAGGNATYSCPRDFELHGHRCYKALDQSASWPEAKEYCKILGGKLAAIASNYEQTIISGIITKMIGKISNPHYWLDGSDMLDQNKWLWMEDHGYSVPFSYTNWNPGEPNHKIENCLEARGEWQSRWNNAACKTENSFICEAKAVATEGEIVNDTLQDP